MDKSLCCHDLISGGGKPFGSLDVTIEDYYDGLVYGIARCQQCGEMLRVVLLDRTSDCSIRIFAASPIEAELYYRIKHANDERVAATSLNRSPPNPHFDEFKKILTVIIRPDILFGVKMPFGPVITAECRNEKCDIVGQPLDYIYGEPRFDWFEHLGINRALTF
jgi:hypothetical protein